MVVVVAAHTVDHRIGVGPIVTGRQHIGEIAALDPRHIGEVGDDAARDRDRSAIVQLVGVEHDAGCATQKADQQRVGPAAAIQIVAIAAIERGVADAAEQGVDLRTGIEHRRRRRDVIILVVPGGRDRGRIQRVIAIAAVDRVAAAAAGEGVVAVIAVDRVRARGAGIGFVAGAAAERVQRLDGANEINQLNLPYVATDMWFSLSSGLRKARVFPIEARTPISRDRVGESAAVAGVPSPGGALAVNAGLWHPSGRAKRGIYHAEDDSDGACAGLWRAFATGHGAGRGGTGRGAGLGVERGTGAVRAAARAGTGGRHYHVAGAD